MVTGLDEHELGLACSVVGESNDLITHCNVRHPRADLLHDAGEITALPEGNVEGQTVGKQPFSDGGLARINACGFYWTRTFPGPELGRSTSTTCRTSSPP